MSWILFVIPALTAKQLSLGGDPMVKSVAMLNYEKY